MVRIFVNADIDGNITDALIGDSVIPDKDYEFMFESENFIDNFDDYLIVRDGEHAKMITRESSSQVLSL